MPGSKEAAIEALKNDYVVALFPEGTRNKSGKGLKEFKYGAVSFAQKSGKPIIPMGITKRPKLFKRSLVKIGKPFYVKKNDDLTKANEKLQKIVLDLIS